METIRLPSTLTTRMRTRYGAHVLALPYMLGLALAVCLFIFHFTMYSGAFVGTADVTGQVVALTFNYALVGIIWWGCNLRPLDPTRSLPQVIKK